MTADGAAQQKLIVSNVTSLSPPPQAGSTASRIYVCLCVCVRDGGRESDKRAAD